MQDTLTLVYNSYIVIAIVFLYCFTVMKEKKTEVVTVRFTPSVKKKLQKKAQEAFRTLSQEIEMRVLKSLGKG